MLDPQASVAYSPLHQKGVFSCMNFTLRRLGADDLAAADRLRADLGWNQTITDWQLCVLSYPKFQASGTSARESTRIFSVRRKFAFPG